MRIGYLHIGPSQNGIRRYSELIASEAHRQGMTVIEADVALTESRQRNRVLFIDAAQKLSSANVIHFQYFEDHWGRKARRQLYYFWLFMRRCPRPLVVTLHDTFLERQSFSWRNMADYASTMYRPNVLALRWMLNRVQQVFVCTEEEARRLNDFFAGTRLVRSGKIKVLPHFVEQRQIAVSQASARKALGLEGVKTVTLLGYIFPRKGHRLMVEVIPKLPPDVKVIFAGRPSRNCEWLVEEILSLARATGTEDRLRITGYLSEEELERYLMATDIAVCPFQTCSASSSLSSWISVAHPKILAYDLPQIAEYNQLEPGAIHTFQPYTPEALAQSIQKLLLTPGESQKPAVERLQQKLAMPAIFDQHLRCYSQAAAIPYPSSNQRKISQVLNSR